MGKEEAWQKEDEIVCNKTNKKSRSIVFILMSAIYCEGMKDQTMSDV